jgi:hypothetical protein
MESVAAFTECLARAGAAGFDEVVFYWPYGNPGTRFWADLDVVADAVAAART